MPAASPTPQAQATLRHRSRTGADPAALAVAPATWTLVGEHTDGFGGVVVAGLADLQVAAAVTPRADGRVTVEVTDSAGTRCGQTDTARLEELAGAQEAQIDENGRETVPPAPSGGPAERLGGLVWELGRRQLVSREVSGADVTVVSGIGPAGLGAPEAADAAVALALRATDPEAEDDTPVRARLAEACTAAARTFSATAPLPARHAAALRCQPGRLAVVDYADGSVTPVPTLGQAGLAVFVVSAPARPGDTEDSRAGVERLRDRERFAVRAARAFGTETLRALPDAPTRAVEWLRAVHEVHGPSGAPSVADAENWLGFWRRETQRGVQVRAALRSRHRADVLQGVADSARDLAAVFEPDADVAALAATCTDLGASVARPAHAGLAGTVVAVVDAGRAGDFARRADAEGLIATALPDGTAAHAV